MNRLKGVDDESSEDERTDASIVNANDDNERASSSEDGDVADSSEESSDDDEEEIAKVREGFIVDSDTDASDTGEAKRKPHRKRRRRKSESPKSIELDEDDLDLLGETQGVDRSSSTNGSATGARFKRLKRAANIDQESTKKGLDAMFDDQHEEIEAKPKKYAGEFDDFIEADDLSEDDDEMIRRQEEQEIGRRNTRKQRDTTASGIVNSMRSAIGDIAGLNEEKLSEIYEVFGDGEIYDWALVGEEEDGFDGAFPPTQDATGKTDLQLTDVFEPSELSARMLTAEDNAIRSEDLPERYQILRQRLKKHSYELNEVEFNEKKDWIAMEMMKILTVSDPELIEPTLDAIKRVVGFISKEHLEVPFIWHHRQDYLVHFNSTSIDAVKTQLLTLDDLWHVLDLDLDFHAIVERRDAAKKLINLADMSEDEDVKAMLSNGSSGVDYQDIIDYIQFQASARLRAARRHSRFSTFDRVRNSLSMELVRSFKLDPAEVIKNFKDGTGLIHSDPSLNPQEVETELSNGASLHDAMNYCSHAIAFYPKIRQYFRTAFETHAKIDLILTDDGRRKITMNSMFADLKYSCNWTLSELRNRPELFLRMLLAESQGLFIVRAQFPQYKTTLYNQFLGAIAGNSTGEWFECRSSIAKQASRIIVPMIARNVMENLRLHSIRTLRYEVRKSFAERLNQAPYKPPGYVLGTIPRVMVISAGEAGYMDAVLATVVDEDGHVSDVIKLGDQKSADFSNKLKSAIKDILPDVLGVAGFTANARRLHDSIKKIVNDDDHNGTDRIMAGPEESKQPLEVIWVQDEVARLYRHSEKAAEEFPELVPNARYSVACARYVQSPLMEYAQLDQEQLRNLLVHKHQSLLPPEEFDYATESAFVDAVSTVGVNLNQAVRNPYVASLLRFVAGLGPRKASGIIQSVLSRARGGRISLRMQLVTAEITPRIVFMNCASFLRIPWSQSRDSLDDENTGDYLDSTRVHPEDYELARKMCADALDLDEEDIEAIEERTTGGVVGKLVSDDVDGTKLDVLALEAYAEELEQFFKQKKRVTLGNIRNEIQDPYSEKRKFLHMLTNDEVFTMLTGQIKDNFMVGSVVSGNVRRVSTRQLLVTLSGGIDGIAESGYISDDRSVPIGQQFAAGQSVQAVIENVDYAALLARINTKATAVQSATDAEQRRMDKIIHGDENHWNSLAEDRDIEVLKRKEREQQRQMRVIKHPLFHPFNAREAEAFLAPRQRGDIVIRPSSRGLDHLVVTWKVADQIYQHLDVQELDKPNDYALGKTLCIGNFRYNDLDELLIMHVQRMIKMVDDMVSCDKFQQGNKRDVEKWLSAYTNARPTQSVYAFCFDHRRPGYFLLCYMLGANQPIKELHVKVVPNGFEFMRSAYPNVHAVINGFKMMAQKSR